jgi:hypothetical protein
MQQFVKLWNNLGKLLTNRAIVFRPVKSCEGRVRPPLCSKFVAFRSAERVSNAYLSNRATFPLHIVVPYQASAAAVEAVAKS